MWHPRKQLMRADKSKADKSSHRDHLQPPMRYSLYYYCLPTPAFRKLHETRINYNTTNATRYEILNVIHMNGKQTQLSHDEAHIQSDTG